MRRRSKRQARLYREFRHLRQKFLQEKPFCMGCGATVGLSVHEMTSGSNRMRGFVTRHAWLSACRECNCDKFTDKLVWPLERQMALKQYYDPEFYSLSTNEDILGRKLDEVSLSSYYEELKAELWDEGR